MTGRCPGCGHPWDDHTARQHEPPADSDASAWVTGSCGHQVIVDEGRRYPCLCHAIRPGPAFRARTSRMS